MESTFLRSGGEASKASHTSTFDRDGYSKELNDAFESISSFNAVKAETVKHNLLTVSQPVDYCLLKPHELFPGYTVDKPSG